MSADLDDDDALNILQLPMPLPHASIPASHGASDLHKNVAMTAWREQDSPPPSANLREYGNDEGGEPRQIVAGQVAEEAPQTSVPAPDRSLVSDPFLTMELNGAEPIAKPPDPYPPPERSASADAASDVLRNKEMRQGAERNMWILRENADEMHRKFGIPQTFVATTLLAHQRPIPTRFNDGLVVVFVPTQRDFCSGAATLVNVFDWTKLKQTRGDDAIMLHDAAFDDVLHFCAGHGGILEGPFPSMMKLSRTSASTHGIVMFNQWIDSSAVFRNHVQHVMCQLYNDWYGKSFGAEHASVYMNVGILVSWNDTAHIIEYKQFDSEFVLQVPHIDKIEVCAIETMNGRSVFFAATSPVDVLLNRKCFALMISR